MNPVMERSDLGCNDWCKIPICRDARAVRPRIIVNITTHYTLHKADARAVRPYGMA